MEEGQDQRSDVSGPAEEQFATRDRAPLRGDPRFEKIVASLAPKN
jgi:hypothetical protein